MKSRTGYCVVMRQRIITIILLALAASIWPHASQAAPASLSFTGRLSDADGPLSGSVALEFRIYDADTGGALIWEEAQDATAQAGLVYAALGAVDPIGNALDTAVFDGTDRWLEISVNGVTMSPRTAIRSVPYAIHATRAQQLGDLGPEDVQERVYGTCQTGSWLRSINQDGSVECEADPGGDITDISVGAGLLGGGGAGAISIDADTTYLQRRVTDSCPTGQSIRAIDSTGAVICHVDSDSGGDITSVAPGVGLTGGGVSGSVSLAADTTYLQRRVIGSCPTGQSIRTIDASGMVTCEVDTDTNSGGDITGVVAGTGLIGGATFGDATLTADTSYLQRRIIGSCPLGMSIRAIDSTGGVTCEPDDDSGGDISAVTAGVGLSGGGPSGAVTLTATQTAIASSGVAVTVETACTHHTGAAITLNVPSSGTVMVHANARMRTSHVSGSAHVLTLALGDAPTDCGSPANRFVWTFPATYPTAGDLHHTFHVMRAFLVTAGAHTFYLNGLDDTTGASEFAYADIQAVFHPN